MLVAFFRLSWTDQAIMAAMAGNGHARRRMPRRSKRILHDLSIGFFEVFLAVSPARAGPTHREISRWDVHFVRQLLAAD